jgi:hypothetical protein
MFGDEALMKGRSKTHATRPLSSAALKALAETCAKKMHTLSSYDHDFMWHDLDAFRETWLEYRHSPDDYDFHALLDAAAEASGWSKKRLAALKKTAQPTTAELKACIERTREEGYEWFRVATVQELKHNGKTVGLALIEIGGAPSEPEYYLRGAFRTRKQLDAYAKKNGMA